MIKYYIDNKMKRYIYIYNIYIYIYTYIYIHTHTHIYIYIKSLGNKLHLEINNDHEKAVILKNYQLAFSKKWSFKMGSQRK